MQDERELLLTLNSVRGIGAVIYQRLLFRFGSIFGISEANPSHLQSIPAIGPGIAGDVARAFRNRSGAIELEKSDKLGIRVITCADDDYPMSLKTLYNFPLAIYVKGTFQKEDECAIGVVGSRKATYYGKQVAEHLAWALAGHGIRTTSGLARGIDTCAHEGALKGDGRTIAVIGSGLLRIYPEENLPLAEKIAQNGAVISELPLNSPPDPRNFPQRNRIISALSLGILIVEAPEKSGAMITAEWAMEQGKEIFAVPGRIDSDSSKGCHQLIKLGAKLTESVTDIIEELAPRFSAFCPIKTPDEDELWRRREPAGLSEAQEKLLQAIKEGPTVLDELIDRTGLSPQDAAEAVFKLELSRHIKRLPGNVYVAV